MVKDRRHWRAEITTCWIHIALHFLLSKKKKNVTKDIVITLEGNGTIFFEFCAATVGVKNSSHKFGLITLGKPR
jgi:hypothetical protein